MHAITNPYDMIHVRMYAQELMRAKSLKVRKSGKHDYPF